MAKSESQELSEGSSKELSIEYHDFLKNFPHEYGFAKEVEEKEENNNFFNASFHCLTNIEILSKFFIKYYSDNECIYQFIIPYKNLLLELIEDKNDENQDDKNISINEKLKELKNHITNKMKYNFSKDNDPRKLVACFLNDLESKNILPKEIKTHLFKKCDSCGKNFEQLALKIFKFDIIKIYNSFYSNNDNKILPKEITIEECFNYYFNQLKREKFNCSECHKQNIYESIKNLPDILIIFIEYGSDKNCYLENPYNFEENINFKNCNFIEGENKNKKYFLSSIIVGKNLGTNFIYTTYCKQKNKKKGNEQKGYKYIYYNGKEVKRHYRITKKIKNAKIDLKDEHQSWPFVLIYINKNYLFD